MAGNPLQKHFRQPKIYVGLPSKGVYNAIGSIQGDATHMPIYGMTGMDEIIMKTPDALLSGDSTVSIIQSCCPTVRDAWDLSSIDSDLVLTAIKIATYGNVLDTTHKCPHCGHVNEYEIEMSRFIEHYSKFVYDDTIVLGEMTIKLRPLTYRQVTEFALVNFGLQQQLKQANALTDQDQQTQVLKELFVKLGKLQNDIYTVSIDSVQTAETVVTETSYIKEWIENSDKHVFDAIKAKLEINRTKLQVPPQQVTCTECEKDSSVSIDMDPSNFFAQA